MGICYLNPFAPSQLINIAMQAVHGYLPTLLLLWYWCSMLKALEILSTRIWILLQTFELFCLVLQLLLLLLWPSCFWYLARTNRDQHPQAFYLYLLSVTTPPCTVCWSLPHSSIPTLWSKLINPSFSPGSELCTGLFFIMFIFNYRSK